MYSAKGLACVILYRTNCVTDKWPVHVVKRSVYRVRHTLYIFIALYNDKGFDYSFVRGDILANAFSLNPFVNFPTKLDNSVHIMVVHCKIESFVRKKISIMSFYKNKILAQIT